MPAGERFGPAGGSVGAAACLLLGCRSLILEEFLQAPRNGAKADGLHHQKHDPVESPVLEHLGVGVDESVESEPEGEGNEKHREKDRVVDRVRRRAAVLAGRVVVGLSGSFAHGAS